MFVKERNQFLKFLDGNNNTKNVVFIAIDVHFEGTVNITQDLMVNAILILSMN
jgi:phosphodiesterase/alkaline phosphatase D-like protein